MSAVCCKVYNHIHSSPLSKRLAYTAIAGFLSTVAVILCLLKWNRSEWMTYSGSFTPTWEGYDLQDFFAIFFFTLFAPVSFCLTFTVIQYYIRATSTGKSFTQYILTVSFAGLVLLVIAALGGVWSWNILQCGVIFCINTDSHTFLPYFPPEPEAGLGFKSTIGFSYMLPAIFLFIALVANVLSHLMYMRYHRRDTDESSASLLMTSANSRRYTPYNTHMLNMSTKGQTLASSTDITKRNVKRSSEWGLFAIVFVLLVLMWFTTTYVPNNWEYFTPSRIAAKAQEMATNVITECGDWPHKSCPEVIPATFTTINWAITKHFNAKIYPGNLMFYLYLIAVPLAALLIRLSQRVEEFGDKKINVSRGLCGRCREGHVTGVFFSVKEIALIVFTLIMSYCFFHYWFFDHNFNGYFPDPEQKIHLSERLGRALGQVAVLLMSLLMFPAARNSPMLALLGISWEASVKYHRWLGIGFVLMSIGHMVGVYWWYYVNDLFPQDLFSIPMHLPTSIDNFTVPIIQFILWFCIITFGVIAAYEPCRRKHFDLFLFTHHFSYMIMIPAVLWHAAASWEYLLPGLLVWFVDRTVRFFRSSRAVHLIKPSSEAPINPFDPNYFGSECSTPVYNTYSSIPVVPGALPPPPCTEPGIKAMSMGSAGDFIEIRISNYAFTYMPGHYAFLNVAEISLFEWHPFTIASPVHFNGRQEVVFLIKAMGSNTWTQALYDYVVEKQATVAPGEDFPITVSVDGPYGSPVDFTTYDTVVLVGGGIGVTPCKSIYESLLLSYTHDCKDTERSSNKRIHLMFSARDTAMFNIMSESLAQIPTGPFTAKLFCDNPNDPQQLAHESHAHPIARLTCASRPNVEQELLSVVNSNGAVNSISSINVNDIVAETKQRVLIFVCGPDGLAQACEEAAHQHGWDYHTETFAL